MTDKIIKLNNNLNICIIDEIEYKGKKYVYGIECDSKEENIIENYYVLEAKLEGSDLIVDDIDDVERESVVHNIFLSRLKNK